ncbi:MAG: single-stranded DNA-binding protein [Bacteriovoracaceae bacterium]|nr:single-stranded DNA-binding protein [Bacteriovoracaceae bacterium]
MSLNKVMILGRLGQDPELKYTPSGAAVCNFSLATSESWTDKSGQKQERTEWHRIVVWGKLGELCNQYLSKGRQAFVEGTLQTRSWEAKDGSKRYTTEISAKNVQFIGGASTGASRGGDFKSNDMNQDAPMGDNALNQDYNVSTDANFTADDIPF